MEIMRDWIAPLVEAALCSYLGEPFPDEAALRNPLKLVEDDNTLRIRVGDQKLVQVAQWSPGPEPIRGTLSDSVTTISSVFSRESTEIFLKKARKRLTSNTRGAIIKINEFDIVISYARAHSPEISLFILDFPLDVSGNSRLSSLARKCSRKCIAQRNGRASPNGEGRVANVATNSDSDSDSDASSLRSQAYDSTAPLSQEQFISQAPYRRRLENPQVPARKDAVLPKKKNATLILSALTSKSRLAEPISTIPNEKPCQTGQSNRPLSREFDADIDQIGFATQLVPSIEKTSPIHEEINSNGSCDAESLSPCRNPVASTSLSHISDTRSPRVNKSRNKNNVASQKGRDKSTDNTDPNTSPKAPKLTVQKEMTTNNSPKANVQTARDDPWRNMTRIRHRDVTIHRDQEDLIQMKESWVPPEPGKQAPQAHVPIRLLQEWNDMHCRRPSRENINGCAASQSTNEEEDLDSELLKSSSQGEVLDSEWAATPQSTSSSHLVPQDSSPLAMSDIRPSLLYPARNVSVRNNDILTRDNVDELKDGPDIPVKSQKASAFGTTPLIEDDDDYSEMGMAVPNGLGNVSQTNEDSGDEEIPRSGALVEQTPYVQAVKRKMATTIHSPRNTDEDSGQSYNKTSSDPLIPSTYDFRCLNVHPESSMSTRGKATRNSVKPSSPAPTERFNMLDCGSMDGDDESMAERQLVSDLDEYMQSTRDEYLEVSATIQAPGTAEDATKPSSPTVNIHASQTEMNPTPLIIGKRKRNEISPKNNNSSKEPKIFRSQASRHNKLSRTIKPTECRQISFEHRSCFGNGILPSKTEGIYNRFKEAYPDYAGSIDNFRKACDELQHQREQNFMKRSFLWDDFVVRYPSYVLQYCDDGESSHIAPYVDYFQREVKKPSCRKRNLTARDLDFVLAERVNENEAKETSFVENHSRRSSWASVLVNEQEPQTQNNIVVHVSSSDEEADNGQEPSIPESNHGELLETASVELGDPNPFFSLSDSEKENATAYEDIISVETKINLMPDGISESVEGHYCSPLAPTATRRACCTNLEIDSDDDSVLLDNSSSNSSLHENNQEENHDAKNGPEKVDRADLPNEHSQVFFRSQARQISPPQSRNQYRRFFHPPPESPQDPLWDLYNKASDVNDPDDPKQWHKSPNTPFKIYARNVAKLQADYGFRQDGSKADPIRVDEDGVVRPPPMGDPQGMGSIGWSL
ncbi:conserved hypothetical protein [Histoplasma capsulatum H143]|uniref:Shelterin complex subunit TPP1/Est3 domain-containing protein n=1 Tax=Ajellomyces capsulatus (strain H143) TaxID=544712 RepID=C6H8M2_AJECH|nr:conserved hypothetical protein [Histoplasma capsulatum H143]